MVTGKRILLAFAAAISLPTTLASAQQMIGCPAVDVTSGERPRLSPPAVQPDRQEFGGAVSVPPNLFEQPLRIVGFFESGSDGVEDAYGNANGTDGLSVGFQQWNHGTGSLYRTLFSRVSRQTIDLAGADIRQSLHEMKTYSEQLTAGRGSRVQAQKVARIIQEWRISEGRIRPEIRRSLRAFLLLPDVRRAQQDAMAPTMRNAYSYARAWQRDTGAAGAGSARLIATFYDIVVYNGGLQGLWVPHVRAFRAQFSSPETMLKYISDWADQCPSRVYSRNFAVRSTRYWLEQWRARPGVYSDAQLDLLALGFLRALRSTGDNSTGYHGIFQADVLVRRGIVALGEGYLRRDRNLVRISFPE